MLAPQRNLLPQLKPPVAAKRSSFSESPGEAWPSTTLDSLISLSWLPREHISLFFVRVDHWGWERMKWSIIAQRACTETDLWSEWGGPWMHSNRFVYMVCLIFEGMKYGFFLDRLSVLLADYETSLKWYHQKTSFQFIVILSKNS